MIIENTILDFNNVLAINEKLAQENVIKGEPRSYCVARFHNEDYCITLAVWDNGYYNYGTTPEIGVRILRTNDFILFRASWRHLVTRYNRMVRLIRAGRPLKL